MTRVLIPRERSAGETRVAGTPETVGKMVAAGLEVDVETGAGACAHFADAAYSDAGATVSRDAAPLWQAADVVLKVAPPGAAAPDDEIARLRSGSVLIGLLEPYRHPEMVARLAAGGVSSLALELLPRITRAQPMDALSSQASIAGYKAVLLAAARLGRYFPLLMTAAGTIRPAKVVVIGAGVAGLQAIATGKRLGAVVEVSDIREAVKEEVESLGGRFIELPPREEKGEGEGGYAREMSEEFLRRQREILKEHVAAADVVVTTAAVPGKKAPLLVPADMVEAMRPGSVIVDLAASRGGNCELTRADEEIEHHGVLILGPANVPATMAHDASLLYSRNVLALLLQILDDGAIKIDPEDELLTGTLLTHDGRILDQALAQKAQEVSA